MAKAKKISPAKQRIIENYEKQKERLLSEGYEEKQEVISVLKANIMAFLTAGPFVIVGFFIWLFVKETGKGLLMFSSSGSMILFWVVFAALIFVHELLHGTGWVFWTKKKWKSIYLGVMWEYLTPYCHCKEPLRPKQYLAGVLMPFAVLGIGFYIAALITGNRMVLALSFLNMLCAGGDTTIACMLFQYFKQNEGCYILDHPTDCGFVAFVKK